MTINVTGRGTNVKDSFNELLEKKLTRFDRFFDRDTTADVTVTNEGGRETVEVTIKADGMVFRSERTTYERRDSLDQVVEALTRQISKNKSKLRTQMRQSSLDFDAFNEFAIDSPEHDDESDYRIVRSKQFALKPMNVEEAILQMNLLGHEFYMFRNDGTEEVSVVYKRNNGDYGLIEPTPYD